MSESEITYDRDMVVWRMSPRVARLVAGFVDRQAYSPAGKPDMGWIEDSNALFVCADKAEDRDDEVR